MPPLLLSEKDASRLLNTLQDIKALDRKKTRKLQIANKASEALHILHKASRKQTSS